MTLFYNKQSTCLNCGFDFGTANNFCPECGQKNTSPKIGFGTLVMDFLGDVFTFDSKIFKSLWLLVAKPGKLTKEFNKGRRVSYIPPLRMFLILGLLIFGVLALNFGSDEELNRGLVDGFNGGLVQIEGANVKGSDELGLVAKEVGEIEFFGSTISQSSLQEMICWSKNRSLSPKEVVESVGYQDFTEKMVLTQLAKIVSRGPGGIVDWIINNLSIVVLFMVPVFALIMKLFYLRKDALYIDHLIFSFHQHSLVYLALLPFVIFQRPFLFTIPILIILPIYTFLATRRVYEESSGRTLAKQFFTSATYVITAIFVFMIYLVLSFLLF